LRLFIVFNEILSFVTNIKKVN